MPWKKKPGTVKVERKTHEIDASGKVVGRLASHIATILIGKHKPTYIPNIDGGDIVVVKNADQAVLTGAKDDQKKYHRSSGRPSGITTESVSQMKKKRPGSVLKHAVKYMLPKNKLQEARLRRLKIQL